MVLVWTMSVIENMSTFKSKSEIFDFMCSALHYPPNSTQFISTLGVQWNNIWNICESKEDWKSFKVKLSAVAFNDKSGIILLFMKGKGLLTEFPLKVYDIARYIHLLFEPDKVFNHVKDGLQQVRIILYIFIFMMCVGSTQAVNKTKIELHQNYILVDSEISDVKITEITETFNMDIFQNFLFEIDKSLEVISDLNNLKPQHRSCFESGGNTDDLIDIIAIAKKFIIV